MVEFGLKLEDNKVSEWGDHYLDYETLKKILKKAKKAEKKYEETCSENPKEAKEVTQAYRSGKYDDDLKRVPSSQNVSTRTKPSKRMENFEAVQLEEEEDEDEEVGNFSERSSLLKYPRPIDISTSVGIVSAISKVATNMLSSTSLANAFERKVRNNLEEIDHQISAFDNLFYKQQMKVVSFYYTQLQELQTGFESLVEGVLRDQQGTGNSNAATAHDTDDEDGTDANSSEQGGAIISPFPSHRKRNSSVGEKVEELILQLTESVRSIGNKSENGRVPGSRGTRRASSIHLGNKVFLVKNTNISGATDEDFEDEPDWDDADVLKAESIRRSLVDQYRRAKLLQNYAMMNVTGFVKIVKKFDKTVASESGRYKKSLQRQHMLNDAKAVETLSNKYEKYYANWFCNGDTREAKAQMLVKRGDGLDMDWSQLQLGYRMGMCAILAVWVCWDMVWGMIKNGETTIGARYAFPVFRACGGLLLLQWFWGCSVFMWTRYRVNYIFLFDFNPRLVRTPLEIITDAVDNTLTYLCLMLVSQLFDKNALDKTVCERIRFFPQFNFISLFDSFTTR